MSRRCGWIFHLRQIRPTLENEIPNRSAIKRTDQCEMPSSAGGFPLSARVSVMTANSSMTGTRPGLGASFNPSTPASAYLERHFRTVGPDKPVRRPISTFGTPSEAKRTTRARNDIVADTSRPRVSASIRDRSPSRKTNARARYMNQSCPPTKRK